MGAWGGGGGRISGVGSAVGVGLSLVGTLPSSHTHQQTLLTSSHFSVSHSWLVGQLSIVTYCQLGSLG